MGLRGDNRRTNALIEIAKINKSNPYYDPYSDTKMAELFANEMGEFDAKAHDEYIKKTFPKQWVSNKMNRFLIEGKTAGFNERDIAKKMEEKFGFKYPPQDISSQFYNRY